MSVCVFLVPNGVQGSWTPVQNQNRFSQPDIRMQPPPLIPSTHTTPSPNHFGIRMAEKTVSSINPKTLLGFGPNRQTVQPSLNVQFANRLPMTPFGHMNRTNCCTMMGDCVRTPWGTRPPVMSMPPSLPPGPQSMNFQSGSGVIGRPFRFSFNRNFPR